MKIAGFADTLEDHRQTTCPLNSASICAEQRLPEKRRCKGPCYRERIFYETASCRSRKPLFSGNKDRRVHSAEIALPCEVQRLIPFHPNGGLNFSRICQPYLPTFPRRSTCRPTATTTDVKVASKWRTVGGTVSTGLSTATRQPTTGENNVDTLGRWRAFRGVCYHKPS